MTIGKRINALRKQKGYTQEYIADQLNVTRQAVSKWEQDQTSPDTWNLIELAKLLDCSVEYITLGKTIETPEEKPNHEHNESHCGILCSKCKHREVLNCPGCKQRMKQDGQAVCEISICCNSRGLQACWQCKFSKGCKRLTQKNYVAAKRVENANAEQKLLVMQREIAENCRSKVGILAIIAVVYLIALVLASFIPFVTVIPGIAYAFCLFQLRGQSDAYKTAALMMFLAAILQLITDIIPTEQGFVTSALSAAALIVNLIRLRMEYVGHQDICTFFDCNLTDNYSRLWKWYLICPTLEIVALFFMSSPLLYFPALVVLIASLVGLVLAHAMHIRNLFGMKKLFAQEY